MDPQRKLWNEQHKLLNRLVSKGQEPEELLRVFLEQHGAVHSARLNKRVTWSLQDETLDGLTEANARKIPKGELHSILWIVWHITRIEDVTMNLLLADTRQVLERGNRSDRLGTARLDTGNELARREIASISATIDFDELLAYRLAVGKQTEHIVARIKPEEWSKRPEPARVERLVTEGAVPPGSGLLRYWGGHPKSNLLLMPATRHPFVHWNEAERLLTKLAREAQ